MMTVDRQMGLVIVTPEGKVSALVESCSMTRTNGYRTHEQYSRECHMTPNGTKASSDAFPKPGEVSYNDNLNQSLANNQPTKSVSTYNTSVIQ